jgi:hypothetical protein
MPSPMRQRHHDRLVVSMSHIPPFYGRTGILEVELVVQHLHLGTATNGRASRPVAVIGRVLKGTRGMVRPKANVSADARDEIPLDCVEPFAVTTRRSKGLSLPRIPVVRPSLGE